MRLSLLITLLLATWAEGSSAAKATSKKTSKTKSPSKTPKSTLTGTATAFKVTVCKTSLPTPIQGLSGTMTASSGVPLSTLITQKLYPSAKAQHLELEVEGKRYLYDTSSTDRLRMIMSTLEEFSIFSDGSFEYIGHNCSYGIRGHTHYKKAAAIMKRGIDSIAQRNVNRIAERSIIPRAHIDLTLFNQCKQAFPGATPKLKCYSYGLFGVESNIDAAPAEDFIDDDGAGLYTGLCTLDPFVYDFCEVGKLTCSSLGNSATSYSLTTIPCASLAVFAAGAVGGGSEGILLPAAPAIKAAVGAACTIGIGYALNELCAAQDYGPHTHCTPPNVMPAVQLDYVLDTDSEFGLYTTELTLGTITATTSTSVHKTATTLVPSCTQTGNPFPEYNPFSCPKDNGPLYGLVKLCANCYTSGLPGEEDLSWDIVCNQCCGCCYRAKPSDYPVTTPEEAGECCGTKKNPFNCDGCAADDALPTSATCQVAPAEQICKESPADYIYLHSCGSPDKVFLFDPSGPFYQNQQVCEVLPQEDPEAT